MANKIIEDNPSLTQEQVCKLVHIQTGENSNVLREILCFIKRYDSFCKKGEEINRKVLDSLIVRKIAPHALREITNFLILDIVNQNDKVNLINQNISLSKFLEKYRAKNKAEFASNAVENVCKDIKNLHSIHVSTEQDTVNIFLAEIARLEQTLDMIFSDKEDYINTFEGMSDISKEQIRHGCDRLETVKQVMLSVI